MSDPPIVIAILLLLNRLSQQFLKYVSIAGGLFLLYLAYGLFNQWRKSAFMITENPQVNKGDYLRGAILNIFTPGLYIYWSLVNVPLLISTLVQSTMHGILFLLGFYTFFISGMITIAAFFSQTKRLGK